MNNQQKNGNTDNKKAIQLFQLISNKLLAVQKISDQQLDIVQKYSLQRKNTRLSLQDQITRYAIQKQKKQRKLMEMRRRKAQLLRKFQQRDRAAREARQCELNKQKGVPAKEKNNLKKYQESKQSFNSNIIQSIKNVFWGKKSGNRQYYPAEQRASLLSKNEQEQRANNGTFQPSNKKKNL